ncbi:hypothetical protein B0T17DRAFT_621723 [Bombardia bombarda]|uniref:Uncharacterized protein n=1 Tax=Bombardia bombarda TaxID=252184 RepID=A0AA39WC48_9PEZI|nr:hypothetical protein B0T17DRAFT_621723 [Bombardia bombarda]
MATIATTNEVIESAVIRAPLSNWTYQDDTIVNVKLDEHSSIDHFITYSIITAEPSLGYSSVTNTIRCWPLPMASWRTRRLSVELQVLKRPGIELLRTQVQAPRGLELPLGCGDAHATARQDIRSRLSIPPVHVLLEVSAKAFALLLKGRYTDKMIKFQQDTEQTLRRI